MATLIFGGTGFIGSRIARKLVERGEQVVCADLIPDAPASLLKAPHGRLGSIRDRVTIERRDVTKLDDVLAPIKAHQINRIVNMAYILTSEADQNAHLAIQVNALGMSNVFEAARLLGVERVVYASSISTYGDQSSYGERPITEEDVPAPRSLYGTAKLLNDREAEIYRRTFGSSLIGIKIASVFGHGRLRGRSAWAGRFASDPAVGKPAEFPFAPEMRWSMVYVDDAAELFVQALLAPSPQHPIYNCSGYALSLGEMAAGVRELIPDAKHTFGTGVGPSPYLIDSTRAQQEFGWKPAPFVDRLRDHIAEARAAAR